MLTSLMEVNFKRGEYLRFYIYTPEVRKQQIARLLGIPKIYCLAYDASTDRPIRNGDTVYLQTGERYGDHKLKLFQVADHLQESVIAILKPAWNSEEQAQVMAEDEQNIYLARRGLL